MDRLNRLRSLRGEGIRAGEVQGGRGGVRRVGRERIKEGEVEMRKFYRQRKLGGRGEVRRERIKDWKYE